MPTGTPSTPTHAAAFPWWRGWTPLLLFPPAAVLVLPSDTARWALMWTLAFVIYVGCKWLTWRRTDAAAPAWKHLAYLLAWPGLDAPTFLRPPHPPIAPPAARHWLFACIKLTSGTLLLFAAARHAPENTPILVGCIGMLGIILLLHFGLFDVLACSWRSLGINATPLMDAPLASNSLGEFWGRRWNTAFRDITHRFLFRPLTPRLGPRGALIAGFIFSGLVHDAVISLPAQGGYGGPTLYFCIQPIAILFERTKTARRLRLAHGPRGRLFAALVLIAPLPLLFHRPFITAVIVPFMHAIGAL